jgi:D-sedoheptulose 7-phosphate isomerase
VKSIYEHLAVVAALDKWRIQQAAFLLKQGLQYGKVILCGNGGSAADAQHIAAELVGRFEKERPPYRAIALTTDTSVLTAIGNDYGFDQVFARQVEALATPADCLIAISTSGKSANVLNAIAQAKHKGCNIIGLSGRTPMACTVDICVDSDRTCRIQEAHGLIGHLLCELLDA